MQWLYNLNELQYEQLLTVLFTDCDSITCVGSEEQCSKLNGIAYECIGKCPLNMQNLPHSSNEMVPLFQYTFICSEKTKQFFKQQSFYRLHWQMIHMESLSFWKKGHYVFRAISNRFVELEMEPALEK